MDTLIEKITLYDLLGYLVPGVVLSSVLVLQLITENPLADIATYNEFSGAIFFCFLIFSYVCGVILSEVSRIFFELVCYIFFEKKLLGARVGGYVRLDSIGISQLKIYSAMEHAGMNVDRTISLSDLDQKKTDEYLKIMYGDIQCSDSYKRIHNYSSAFVFYKNLLLAIALSGIVLFNFYNVDMLIIIIWIILLIVLLNRCIRFYKKEFEYTVLWFVQKNATS